MVLNVRSVKCIESLHLITEMRSGDFEQGRVKGMKIDATVYVEGALIL